MYISTCYLFCIFQIIIKSIQNQVQNSYQCPLKQYFVLSLVAILRRISFRRQNGKNSCAVDIFLSRDENGLWSPLHSSSTKLSAPPSFPFPLLDVMLFPPLRTSIDINDNYWRNDDY